MTILIKIGNWGGVWRKFILVEDFAWLIGFNDAALQAVLELSDTEETRQLWKGTQFVLSYTIKLSVKTLTLGVSVTNRCPADKLDMAFCFHTYLRTPDATSVRISGLKGVDYIDKTVEGHPVKTEEREEVAVTEFTDRVYKSAPSVVTVTDPDKTLEFEKSPELADYTVWNPWDVNKLGDMGDEDYKNMICVEATAFSKGSNLQKNKRSYNNYDPISNSRHYITATRDLAGSP